MEKLSRIIQESVPGKQVTIAHVIASPGPEIHERIGVPSGESIGILDRFTGSVVVLGDVQSVETAIGEVVRFLHDQMGFCCAEVTRS